MTEQEDWFSLNTVLAVINPAFCSVSNLSSSAWPVQWDLCVLWADAELFPNVLLSKAKGFGVSLKLHEWVCNASYDMLTTPTLHAMSFLTCFSSQVFAGTGSVLLGTRAKPEQGMGMSGPQPKHFIIRIPFSPANSTLLMRIWVHASLLVYIYPWPRCCFPTVNTSSPVLGTLKERISPPSTRARGVKWIPSNWCHMPRHKGLMFLNVESQHMFVPTLIFYMFFASLKPTANSCH